MLREPHMNIMFCTPPVYFLPSNYSICNCLIKFICLMHSDLRAFNQFTIPYISKKYTGLYYIIFHIKAKADYTFVVLQLV